MNETAKDLLNVWFSEPVSSHWFSSTETIDGHLKNQFLNTWEEASRGLHDDWLKSAKECLALIILLDQIPLNIFRGHKKSFATEQSAIAASKHAISMHYDNQLSGNQQAFIYMPLMHSENLQDQELAVSCFEKAGLSSNLRFAKHHRDLIKKFGRFPHRNKILGRTSTPEEIAYLSSPEAFQG